MTFKQEIGNKGENLAVNYIKKKGYRIIDRNYRKKYGEIDIISIATEKTLVFFEVKTLRNTEIDGRLCPEDQLTLVKLRKLQRICSIYANDHEDLVKDDRGWRIDLLAIDLDEEDWKNSQIRHYENI